MSHGVVPAAAADGARGLLAPLARGLARLGVSPNAVTVAGLVVTLCGASVLATDRPLAGGLLLLVGTLGDALDGQLARATGSGTRFGAFLDSTLDRVADAALGAAAIWLGHAHDDPVLLLTGVAALVASSLVPYVRAKAEALGMTAAVGTAPREARVALYLIGVLLWAATGDGRAFLVAVIAVAVLATLTVVERVVHVTRALRSAGRHQNEGNR